MKRRKLLLVIAACVVLQNGLQAMETQATETGAVETQAAETETVETETAEMQEMETETAEMQVTEEQESDDTEGGQTDEEWESDTDFGTEKESEGQTEPCSETETESEESICEICVSKIWPAYETGYKIYDGTAYVELGAEVLGLPDGMAMELWGTTESADVGCWIVTPQISVYWLADGAPAVEGVDYEIHMETEPLEISVLPRPLTITVSDGVKYYFEELDISKVEFLTETLPVQVSGFVEAEALVCQEYMTGEEGEVWNAWHPEGFELPELELNGAVIQKESPMYREGQLVEYKQAIVVKVDEEGKPTGNPTKNYCFVLDPETEYYEPGSIFLREPYLAGTLDYRIKAVPESGMYRDGQGSLWLRSGSSLEMLPQEGCGFNQGTQSSSLSQSGVVELRLQKVNKKGEVMAVSAAKSIAYQIDDTAPDGMLALDGTVTGNGEVLYRNRSVSCEVMQIKENGSGLRSVQICAVSGGWQDPAGLYQNRRELWTEGTQVNLTAEGIYTVYARLEDQVGNVRFLSSAQVVLDWTAPGLEIQGLFAGSANNGEVAPVIFCQDETYEEGSLTVVFEGNAVGEKSFAQTREKLEFGERIVVGDIPREKKWDDLYVLRAKASDLAGNVTEKTLAFSVNRYGSVYKMDGASEEKIGQYYMKEPTDLVVWEFNVDTVNGVKIRVGHEGTLKSLVQGKSYHSVELSDQNGWKQYCYRIPAVNFAREGAYYVTLSSTDRAGNRMDSSRQRLKIEFAVDQTAPSVLVSGVEEEKSYAGQKRTVLIACRDNQNLKQVQIYLNGELVRENEEEQQELTVESRNIWQELKVAAVDEAGNSAAPQMICFYLGEEEPPARQTVTGTQTVTEMQSVSEKQGAAENQTAAEIQTGAERRTASQGSFFTRGGAVSDEEESVPADEKEGKTGVQIVIFAVILGIVGGYLYKIKGVK